MRKRSVGSEAPQGAEPERTNSPGVPSLSPNRPSAPMCLSAATTHHSDMPTTELMADQSNAAAAMFVT